MDFRCGAGHFGCFMTRNRLESWTRAMIQRWESGGKWTQRDKFWFQEIAMDSTGTGVVVMVRYVVRMVME